MDNIDEVAAYKNENGSFDVIVSFMSSTLDGLPAPAPATVTCRNMHLSMEIENNGSIKLVFEL